MLDCVTFSEQELDKIIINSFSFVTCEMQNYGLQTCDKSHAPLSSGDWG